MQVDTPFIDNVRYTHPKAVMNMLRPVEET